MFSSELKKGNTELLVLSVLEARARHGYEIGRLIEQRSGGQLRYRIASLYPLLCRLETRGLIVGRWVEKAGERRRRYYRLTPHGRKALREQRTTWQAFIDAVTRVTSPDHA